MDHKIQHKITTWIQDVFKNRNYEEIKVKFPATDTSGGYAAEMIYVNLVGVKDGKEENTSIIVKKGRDSSVLQDTLNLSRAYASEVRLYAKYIPYLQKFAEKRNVKPFDNIPFCYGTVDTDNQYVIFMENLKERHYKLHDIEKPIDLNHAELVIIAYAKIHALWLALRDQEPKVFDEFKGECGPNFVGTKVFECIIETAHKELDSVIDIYKEKKKPHIIDKLTTLKQNYERLLSDTFLNKDEIIWFYDMVTVGTTTICFTTMKHKRFLTELQL
ncbi:hypothetical protein WA026_017830 [Henosepilachna vigintioctopunctata]|uniref:CHK kinase-like domain-containing protein n=1 Tax=Henosepilachna vigintioctopunctata TaxID=420089 RepID=A0AAW1TWC1_9CUCU